MSGIIQRPQFVSERGAAAEKERELAKTKLRERANSLLSYEPFIDWAGDLMVSVGFFGEGRELTPYQQGCRGKIVQEIEKLCEIADGGADFLARVFKEKVCAKSTKSTERN
jgi:hypothetical protein